MQLGVLVWGLFEQNRIKLYYNDIKSYINIGGTTITLNVRDCNETPSLLEKTLKGSNIPMQESNWHHSMNMSVTAVLVSSGGFKVCLLLQSVCLERLPSD